ncbi:hypothetical protein D9M68_459170 [compost metagenome]
MRRNGTGDGQFVQRLRCARVLREPLLERTVEQSASHIILGFLMLSLTQLKQGVHIQCAQMRQRSLQQIELMEDIHSRMHPTGRCQDNVDMIRGQGKQSSRCIIGMANLLAPQIVSSIEQRLYTLGPFFVERFEARSCHNGIADFE